MSSVPRPLVALLDKPPSPPTAANQHSEYPLPPRRPDRIRRRFYDILYHARDLLARSGARSRVPLVDRCTCATASQKQCRSRICTCCCGHCFCEAVAHLQSRAPGVNLFSRSKATTCFSKKGVDRIRIRVYHFVIWRNDNMGGRVSGTVKCAILWRLSRPWRTRTGFAP